MGLGHGHGLPREIRTQLALAKRERSLAWASGSAGEWYVGTDRALYIAGRLPIRRLPWEQVERADWHASSNLLSIVEVADDNGNTQRHELPVADSGRLLELLRERVTRSVLLRQYEPVRGKLGVSVVARRAPTGNGGVTWSTVLAAGLDPADPDVRRAIANARSRADSELRTLEQGN